jgi:DNA (cytosine-5)-methyltransferase 1
MGEQVAGKAGLSWLDGVCVDLEGGGYACRAVDIPALAVDAPHIRNRLYWVAMGDASAPRLPPSECEAVVGERRREEGRAVAESGGSPCVLANAEGERGQSGFREGGSIVDGAKPAHNSSRNGTFWSDAEWLECADGKWRRAPPGIPLVAHGLPARVPRLRAIGNALCAPLAAEVIAAFMDVAP